MIDDTPLGQADLFVLSVKGRRIQRVIIAGSRSLADYDLLGRAMLTARHHFEESGHEWAVDTVVSGGARGVDRLAEQWAAANGHASTVVPITEGEWLHYGRAAGPIRNEKMAEMGDALVAVWDGRSRGTGDMINRAEDRGIPVFLWIETEVES